MTSIVQGSLTILNAHTDAPSVYWNGSLVLGITDIKVVNNVVTLTLPDAPAVTEMKLAGVVIKRS